MDEGVATFSGLFLDRSGWNLKLRFSLYGYNRSTGDWNETGIHFDTDFFHVGEGVPAALLLEQVGKETPGGFMRRPCARLVRALRRFSFRHHRSVYAPGSVGNENGKVKTKTKQLWLMRCS